MMFFFDMIGTIAFAVAGALVGVQKRLDVFGVIVLALATAVGGGIVRDVVISNTPPMAFRNHIYVLISIISAVIVMFMYHKAVRYNILIQVCDALGLGAFAVAGANMAMDFGYHNIVTVAFLSVVTAVGGGVIRDIFVGEIPGVFRHEVYAVAALAGAIAFYYAYPYLTADESMYLCFVVTTGLRLIAMKFKWNLPVV